MKYQHIPYRLVDGIPTFKDSDFEYLYMKLRSHGLLGRVFFDGTMQTVEEFIAFMKSGSNMVFVILRKEDGEPVGFWWLNNISWTHAWVHFTAFREIWGTPYPVVLGKEAMSICLNDLGFSVIMGMTPTNNKLALKYIKEVGLKPVAEIPGLLWDGKKQRSMAGLISKITKKDLE